MYTVNFYDTFESKFNADYNMIKYEAHCKLRTD